MYQRCPVCQILLTEKLDEGLMVLRRLLGWDLIDVTYTKMMETKQGTKRYDGQVLAAVPNFEDLPPAVRYGLR